jgi:alanine dehydrogenase
LAFSPPATRALAREEAGVLAILGSGVQARSHLEAIGLVRRLRDVRVWSPTAARRERFVARHQDAAPVVRAASSAEEAVAGADLVVLVTASSTPVVRRGWIAAGAHICAVGACRPDMREMDTALVAASRLFVDSRAGALAEAGDLVIPIGEGDLRPDHIAGEVGELLAGRIDGRRTAEEITIFKSLGMAIEDVAAADLAYRRAAEVGLGRGLVL